MATHDKQDKTIMRNQIDKKYLKGTTEEEIKNEVKTTLESYGCTVVNDAAEAEQYFKDWGIEGDLDKEVHQKFEMVGDDYVYKVVVRAYYKDAGSDDYIYQVDVQEM